MVEEHGQIALPRVFVCSMCVTLMPAFVGRLGREREWPPKT